MVLNQVTTVKITDTQPEIENDTNTIELNNLTFYKLLPRLLTTIKSLCDELHQTPNLNLINTQLPDMPNKAMLDRAEKEGYVISHVNRKRSIGSLRSLNSYKHVTYSLSNFVYDDTNIDLTVGDKSMNSEIMESEDENIPLMEIIVKNQCKGNAQKNNRKFICNVCKCKLLTKINDELICTNCFVCDSVSCKETEIKIYSSIKECNSCNSKYHTSCERLAKSTDSDNQPIFVCYKCDDKSNTITPKGLTDCLSAFFTPVKNKRKLSSSSSYTTPPITETFPKKLKKAKKLKIKSLVSSNINDKKLSKKRKRYTTDFQNEKNDEYIASLVTTVLNDSYKKTKKKPVTPKKRIRRKIGTTVDISPISKRLCPGLAPAELYDVKLFRMSQKAVSKDYNCVEVGRNPAKLSVIQFGEYEIDIHFKSSYSLECAMVKKLFICDLCLKYFGSNVLISRHVSKCCVSQPPGNIVYKHDDLVLFKVDGDRQVEYCQNLCLLAKLFLEHKTLHYDVQPFLFYVLCVLKNGAHKFVGYFSKEKFNDKMFNLSCILTLPIYQRKGYGQFLISYSYLISKMNKSPSGPEKPFSTMGEIAYHSYWKRIIVSYFIENENIESISIKDIMDTTGIMACDVIETLEKLSMLGYRGNNAYIIRMKKQIFDKFTHDFKNKWQSLPLAKEQFIVDTSDLCSKNNAVINNEADYELDENKSNGPEENNTTKELESTIESMKILNQDKDVNTESIKSKIIDIPSEKLETADIDIRKDETNKMLDVTDSTFDLKIEKREDNENMPVLDESSFTSEFDIIDDSVNSNKAHNTEKAFANSKIDDSFDLIPGKIESVKDIECLDKETFSNMNESNINNSTINELSEFEQIEASKCENICEKYSENNRVTYPITEDTNRIVNAAVDIFQNLSTECATCPEKNISNCHFSSAATDYKSYPHARNHIMPNTTIRTDSVISERVIPPKQQTTNGFIDYGTCSSAMNDKSYFYNEPNSNKFIKCEKPVNQFDLYRIQQNSHNLNGFNQYRYPMHSNFEGNAPVYPNQNMQNQEYMSIMYAKKIKQEQMNFISQQNYLLKLNQLQNAYLAQQSNPQTEFQNYNRNAYTSLSRSANVNKDYPNQFYNQPSQHYNSENYYAPDIHQNTQFNRYQNSSNYQYGYSSQNISTNFQNCHFRFPKDNRKSPDFKSPFYPPDK